jgi:hypothetical protein
MSISNAIPKRLRPGREKGFGLARGSCAHDRNARVRIAYVLAWNAKHKEEASTNGRSPLPIIAGIQKANDGPSVPDHIGSYFWYQEEDYRSYVRVELRSLSGALEPQLRP